MRRVYCSTCPWTQWLLLASVGILHGQAAPTLDSVSLHILQGTLNEKLASGEDLAGDAEEETNSNLSVEQVKEKTEGLGEITNDDTILFTVDDKDANCDLGTTFNADKSLIEANPTSHKGTVTGDKNTIVTLTPMKKSSLKTRHTSPKNNPSEHKKTLKVSHSSPKDCNFSEQKHNQQTCPVSKKENKSLLQEIRSLPKEHNLSEERNSIETSHAHHKQHFLHKDDLPMGSSHTYHKKHHLSENVISSETGYTSHSSMSALVQQQSISVQVTPRKLGILASKWVQVKVPRQIEVGIQTEPLPSHETLKIENLVTQTHVKGYVGCLPKAFADKEAQTIIKTIRETSSQTGSVNLRTENQPPQPLWRMISLSGVPNRKNHWAPGRKSKMKNNIDNDQEESNNLGKRLENSSTESSTLKGRRHFHGRPMLKGKMTKPLEIPLDSVVGFLDSALQDPRLFLKSNCM